MTKTCIPALVAAALGVWASAAHASTIAVGHIAVTTVLAGVPEPASLLLFGTALGIAARQLRKRAFHNS